jgi:hypothetical protein
LSTDTAKLRRFTARQEALVEELSWKAVAKRFQALAASCLSSKRARRSLD